MTRPLATLRWTQRQDIGPSARFGQALAYDVGNKRTLLVGGDGLSVADYREIQDLCGARRVG
jgi:hypothetical protein